MGCFRSIIGSTASQKQPTDIRKDPPQPTPQRAPETEQQHFKPKFPQPNDHKLEQQLYNPQTNDFQRYKPSNDEVPLYEDKPIGIHVPEGQSWISRSIRVQQERNPQTANFDPLAIDLASGIIKIVHFGVECDVCSNCPIIGMRYHCSQCESYDLCQKCMDAGKVTLRHKTSHKMELISKAVQN